MSKIKNKKGMTLIEVIIIIAIIGIVSAISIVSFTVSTMNAEARSAGEEVIAVLREAQNYSLTGKNISSACSNYTVDFISPSSYRLHNGLGSCGLNNLYTLKNGVTLAVLGDTTFRAPFGDVAASRTVLARGSARYTVCVNSAGRIIGLNGNVACPT